MLQQVAIDGFHAFVYGTVQIVVSKPDMFVANVDQKNRNLNIISTGTVPKTHAKESYGMVIYPDK